MTAFELWLLAYIDRHGVLLALALSIFAGAITPAPARAQELTGIAAYTQVVVDSAAVVLATPAGRFSIELGLGCDDLIVGQNVELLPGSGDVASIASPGSTYLCNVAVVEQRSADPCRTNDAGACDVRFDVPFDVEPNSPGGE